MKTQVINIYENFTCLMSDCPDTCCRGWQIYVDDDCLEEHKKLRGFERIKSLLLIRRFGKPKILCPLGHCPYERRDGLCTLHAQDRCELMSLVCRTFPRRSIKLGSEMEVTLELSCPEVARLYVEAEKTYFEEYVESSVNNPIEPIWYMSDHEPAFLQELKDIRERLIDYTYQADDILRACRDMYVYMTFYNSAMLFDKQDVKDMSIEQALALTDELDDEIETYISAPKRAAELTDETRARGLFYPMSVYDKMLMEDVCHQGSRSKRILGNYLKVYRRIFDDMEVELADDYIEQKFTSMIESEPRLVEKYKKYLIYNFQQTITACYEDYQILRAYLLTMVSLQTMMTMDVCRYVNISGCQDQEVDTTINQLYSYEVNQLVAIDKSHRHNLSTQKSLMKRIRDELLS